MRAALPRSLRQFPSPDESGRRTASNLHEEKQEGYYRSERSYGSFYRLIPLPSEVKEDQINAKFNNGILEVTVPIPESERKRREIPIDIAAGEQSKAATGGKTKS